MDSPGRRRMTASQNEFAARMAAKPLPDSLNSDPAHRIFHDPPEMIQMAFGGRPWFLETGCTAVHRVGLFKGLGWAVSPLVTAQDELGITHVRVTARTGPGNAGKYDIEFIQCVIPDDHMDKLQGRIVAVRMGLILDELKPQYAAVLGEHAV